MLRTTVDYGSKLEKMNLGFKSSPSWVLVDCSFTTEGAEPSTLLASHKQVLLDRNGIINFMNSTFKPHIIAHAVLGQLKWNFSTVNDNEGICAVEGCLDVFSFLHFGFSNATGQIQKRSILGQKSLYGIWVYMNECLQLTSGQTVQDVLH